MVCGIFKDFYAVFYKVQVVLIVQGFYKVLVLSKVYLEPWTEKKTVFKPWIMKKPLNSAGPQTFSYRNFWFFCFLF